MDNNIDGVVYDSNHDDNNISTQAKRVPIAPLQLQGGNRLPVVETVTENDIKEATAEQEYSQLSTKRALVPSTLSPILKPQKPEYDPVKDESPPATITLSYVPLLKEK